MLFRSKEPEIGACSFRSVNLVLHCAHVVVAPISPTRDNLFPSENPGKQDITFLQQIPSDSSAVLPRSQIMRGCRPVSGSTKVSQPSTEDTVLHLYACIVYMLQEEIAEDDIVPVIFCHSLDFSAIMAAEFGRLSMLSLVICSTLWKPATFIRMSKSASKLFITCLTPSSPLMLSPQTQSLPTKTNFAPRAKALKTSAAPRTPESNMI